VVVSVTTSSCLRLISGRSKYVPCTEAWAGFLLNVGQPNLVTYLFFVLLLPRLLGGNPLGTANEKETWCRWDTCLREYMYVPTF